MSVCLFLVKLICRYDEPGAWYAMLPLEMVYSFDPVPPPPPELIQEHTQDFEDADASASDRCFYSLFQCSLFSK